MDLAGPGVKPVLYGDNLSSRFLTRNASLYRRSKHIDVPFAKIIICVLSVLCIRRSGHSER